MCEWREVIEFHLGKNTAIESGTVDDQTSPEDSDLGLLKTVWPNLSDHIKQAIKTLAQLPRMYRHGVRYELLT